MPNFSHLTFEEVLLLVNSKTLTLESGQLAFEELERRIEEREED